MIGMAVSQPRVTAYFRIVDRAASLRRMVPGSSSWSLKAEIIASMLSVVIESMALSPPSSLMQSSEFFTEVTQPRVPRHWRSFTISNTLRRVGVAKAAGVGGTAAAPTDSRSTVRSTNSLACCSVANCLRNRLSSARKPTWYESPRIFSVYCTSLY
jgi:hypothetical protein